MKGEGNQQDYGFRIYDPRIAKFLSVDPLTRSYPELTPYQFASNTPIWAIDIDGGEGGIMSPFDANKYTAAAKTVSKGVENWLNAPADPGMAHAYRLAANLPKDAVQTNGGLLSAMFIYMGNNYMNRVGNSRIVARVNASNLTPQTPKAGNSW